MRQKRFYRASAILLTALLLITSVVPTCFAAGSVGEVNLHIGQSADTVYLTYTSFDKAAAPVTVTGPLGTNTYPAQSVWSDSAGKYIHQATLTGLTAGTDYTYTLENGTYSSGFTTAAQTGPFTFAFLTDTQVAFDSDARATAALFDQLNQQDDLAFVYIAGDFTDSPRNERQWELLFRGGGTHAGAGQKFLGSHLLAAAQGNHDNSTFSGHISAPSTGADVGNVVYSFDYSNVKFIILNLNNADTRSVQADFLRQEVSKAKAAGQWVIVGFHQSLYSGAGHIVDSHIISARKFWSPLLAELGVDVVMQGHDHVYARGFVTAQGTNAGLTVSRNAFPAGSGAPLYLTGGESGAVKWYNARKYSVQRGDPLAPNYGFLEINSAVAAQNPWGTDTSKTHEQTYTLVSVDGDEMRFQTYMLRYDRKADRMTTAPYLYDSLILHRGAALRADKAALEQFPPFSWNAELADIPMTRGAVVTELYRMAGAPSGVKPVAFPDVSAGTELARAVSWAAAEGIVSGFPDGSFAPGQSVTRAQFAVFAQRYVNAMGGQTPKGGGVGTYRDWRQIPAWAEPALGWAVQTGLFLGRGGNLLAPNATMNRAEGVVCFQRLRFLLV